MSDKEILALSNPSVYPNDDLVFSIIGERKPLWQQILKHMLEDYKDISWSWNYYNDGKQWLFKLVQKKKTIFWGAVLATGEFRITFYFADKAEPLIFGSDLPQRVKENFKTAKKYGAIRPATLLVNNEDDVTTVMKLADIKVKLK
ncbi:MAG TPA: DUF3788 family protein [Bacteroidales bacterium]|nr:DUF3788 family protein [Bacteroidales bacterium]